MLTETIAAISTGGNNSGINIIRISGKEALNIIKNIFTNSSKLEHQKIIYGKIKDDKTQEIIDEVLVSYFKAPNSFTGEDICEINCHGGRKVTLNILKLVLDNGARLAEPGEFSKRAFLNGKMDLSKAEAIIDIINAKTNTQAKIAANQLNGGLYNSIESIRNILIDIMAQIEVSIDYPEYDYEEISNDNLITKLEAVITQMEELIKTFDEGKYIKNGVNMAIVGNTNVGKSSLLNALLKEEKAIVTDIEGTTRDVIEETLIIGDLVINVSDTAGIRKTDDVVEAIGVNKSLKAIEDTDIILLLIDLSKPIETSEKQLLERVRAANKPYIIVLNKLDISRENVESHSDILNDKGNIVAISTHTLEGIEDLKNKILDTFNMGNVNTEENRVIVNERHKELLEKSKARLSNAINVTKIGESLDIAAIDIKECLDLTGNITGKNASEDVVNRIFEKFCLGK